MVECLGRRDFWCICSDEVAESQAAAAESIAESQRYAHETILLRQFYGNADYIAAPASLSEAAVSSASSAQQGVHGRSAPSRTDAKEFECIDDDDCDIAPEPEGISRPPETKTTGAEGLEHHNREPVRINVYNLGHTPFISGFNHVNKEYGAFHTAVEIYGVEWSFGCSSDNESGIASCRPREDPDHAFRESIPMGFTTLSRHEVLCLVNRMRDKWLGCDYSLLAKNCHHFSDMLCRELGCGPPPAWTNALAADGGGYLLQQAEEGWLASFVSTVNRLFTSSPTEVAKNNDAPSSAHSRSVI